MLAPIAFRYKESCPRGGRRRKGAREYRNDGGHIRRDNRRTSHGHDHGDIVGPSVPSAGEPFACLPDTLEVVGEVVFPGSSCWQDHGSQPTEVALSEVLEWLPIVSVLKASARCCKCWGALARRMPIALPPPQVDALLTFCLLETMSRFDDSRAPLGLSAVFGEMCEAARRASACPTLRGSLEDLIIRPLKAAMNPKRRENLEASQRLFLRSSRPQHIVWRPDVKQSSFKNLDRMWKYFHEKKRLIEIHQQRWYKPVGHNKKNTRTCSEYALTKVNREHLLYKGHVAGRSLSFEEDLDAGIRTRFMSLGRDVHIVLDPFGILGREDSSSESDPE